MNFDFSDDQQAIKRTAKDMLAERFKLEKVRELAEAGEYHDEAWKEMCELGWAGIFIDEEHGGQGLGLVELIILCEELGYALAPVPFLSNAAAGLALQTAGSDEQKQRWLPGIASGEARGALGLVRAEGGGPGGGPPDAGEAKLVPDAVGAEVIVLVSSDGAQVVEAANADIEPLDVIDTTRSYAAVRADGGDALPGDGGAAPYRFATALAGELTGVAQRTMEMAVEYARDRKQFNRPIGAYQGVSHRCAQMLLEVEGSRSTSYYAAWCGDAEPESLPLAASMAKAYASDAGWRVTASALQVLGGIGFTWEHDLHFFLKRATVDGVLYGSASEHRDQVAELAGLSREAAPA
jgi:alkylation response protein AidB-like acyl-CoA dehydrogenase